MSCKMLIVEGNGSGRSLVRDILTVHDYGVSAAADGHAAGFDGCLSRPTSTRGHPGMVKRRLGEEQL